MKIVLIILIFTAVFADYKGSEKNGQIRFELDVHKESPVGIYVSGVFDPKSETNNKIDTFLKLFNQYIPILNSIACKDNSLNYEINYKIILSWIYIKINFNFQLFVGWNVIPGGYRPRTYYVGYQPFVYGFISTGLNVTSFPTFGVISTKFIYVKANALILVAIPDNEMICLEGSFIIQYLLSTDKTIKN